MKITAIKSPRITVQPHECVEANTISASLDVHGLDVTICAFDLSPESMAKARSSEAARAAVLKRWENHRAKTGKPNVPDQQRLRS